MTEFIIGFTVYTLGIIGLLVVGFVLAKYFMNNTGKFKGRQKNFLKIEQGMPLEPRKTVYVLKAGKQKFLIATTPENVSFLAELDKDNLQTTCQIQDQQENNSLNNITPPQQMHPDLEAKLKYINFTKSLVGQKPIQR